MILEFKDNNNYNTIKDINMRNGNKLLRIIYSGNGDLYFDIFGEKSVDVNDIYFAAFEINKSDELYNYFEELINNIINCDVYKVDKIELDFCESEEEKNKKIKRSELMNLQLKMDSNYKKLVHDGCIEWYSDSIYDEHANLLKMERINDRILLTFKDNPKDPIFGFGVRISNSGSKYKPFNTCFVNFFNRIQQDFVLQGLTSNKELVKKIK